MGQKFTFRPSCQNHVDPRIKILAALAKHPLPLEVQFLNSGIKPSLLRAV